MRILSKLAVDRENKMPKYNSFANIPEHKSIVDVSREIKTEKELVDYTSSILETEIMNMSQIESEVVWEERKNDGYISEETVVYNKSFENEFQPVIKNNISVEPDMEPREIAKITNYIEKHLAVINQQNNTGQITNNIQL